MAQSDSKMKHHLVIHLEMVRKTDVDNEENLSESGPKPVDTTGEWVVDGIFQQATRGSLKKVKESQVLIQNLHQTTISLVNIRPTRARACMDYSTSVTITIYFYKPSTVENLGKGVPVVLNISDSNEFLKCTFISNKAVLTVECCEKDKLNSIYKNDPTMWPFVFYLSCKKDNSRYFESAQCTGWFIHTESDFVYMDEKAKEKDGEKFSFIISHLPNKTKSK